MELVDGPRPAVEADVGGEGDAVGAERLRPVLQLDVGQQRRGDEFVEALVGFELEVLQLDGLAQHGQGGRDAVGAVVGATPAEDGGGPLVEGAGGEEGFGHGLARGEPIGLAERRPHFQQAVVGVRLDEVVDDVFRPGLGAPGFCPLEDVGGEDAFPELIEELRRREFELAGEADDLVGAVGFDGVGAGRADHELDNCVAVLVAEEGAGAQARRVIDLNGATVVVVAAGEDFQQLVAGSRMGDGGPGVGVLIRLSAGTFHIHPLTRRGGDAVHKARGEDEKGLRRLPVEHPGVAILRPRDGRRAEKAPINEWVEGFVELAPHRNPLLLFRAHTRVGVALAFQKFVAVHTTPPRVARVEMGPPRPAEERRLGWLLRPSGRRVEEPVPLLLRRLAGLSRPQKLAGRVE